MKKIVVGIFIGILTTHGSPIIIKRSSLKSLRKFRKIVKEMRQMSRDHQVQKCVVLE